MNFIALLKPLIPLISAPLAMILVSLIRKQSPALKEKLSKQWPLVAIVLATVLNAVGVNVTPEAFNTNAPPLPDDQLNQMITSLISIVTSGILAGLSASKVHDIKKEKEAEKVPATPAP